mmetsp:Transcript_9529/g.29885  ORF Transcript_9529/g.29885 Transcript_9529/m.29885 type:complete len:282 (-) Transcript_9529:460-1305(-)
MRARDGARDVLGAVAQALDQLLGQLLVLPNGGLFVPAAAAAAACAAAERLFNLRQPCLVVGRHQADAEPLPSCAARAPRAVHVGRHTGCHLNVEYRAHVLEVDAAHHAELLHVAAPSLALGAPLALTLALALAFAFGVGAAGLVGVLAVVSGDEVVEEAAIEGVQDVLPRRLRQLGVEQRRAHAESFEEELESEARVHRVDEEQHAPRHEVEAQQRQRVQQAVARGGQADGRVAHLRGHASVARALRLHQVHRDGRVQHQLAQALNVARRGGADEQALARA